MEQADRPEVVYRAPRTPFVAGFIGQMNLIDGEVRNGRMQIAGMDVMAPIADGPATLAVRPEFLALRHSDAPDAPVARRVIDFGTHLMVDIELKGGERLKGHGGAERRLEGRHAGSPCCRATFALYRDDVVAYRAGDEAVAEVAKPLEAVHG